jgi:uncharacterized repeat protein (TIGR01451 family)
MNKSLYIFIIYSIMHLFHNANAVGQEVSVSDSVQSGGTVTVSMVTVSGRVTDGSAPLADVSVLFSHDEHAALTDLDGNYKYDIPAGTTTILTPGKSGYGDWTPAAVTLSDITSEKTGLDFRGSALKAAEADLVDSDGRTIPSGGTFDFGAVLSGGDTTVSFIIRNSGDAVLTLSAPVEIAGSDAFRPESQPSDTVAPGAETVFSIRFSPSAEGIWTGSVLIGTNDADENPYVLNFSGTGIAPEPMIILEPMMELTLDGSLFAEGSAYDFGSEPRVIFTVTNAGNADLILDTPLSVIGQDASHFMIEEQPSGILPPGASTALRLRFRPLTAGLKTAQILISGNTAGPNSFTLNLQGMGVSPEDAALASGGSERVSAPEAAGEFLPMDGVPVHDPEMVVSGNSQEIVDGDAVPSVLDSTDFGGVGVRNVTRSVNYSIRNAGTTDLTLTGSPAVTLSGTHASDFTVTLQPSTPIASGSTVTFTVRFDPSASGTRSALVTIANDDEDENPYTFAIQGTGLLYPEIDVKGHSSGVLIVNGDSTPSTADGTDFGDVNTVGATAARTYRIRNMGNASLVLSGSSPYVSIGGAFASEFTVTAAPSTPIAAGDSTTFTITFDPAAVQIRDATVTINSNDPDDGAYVFAIQGNGIGPATPFGCVSNFYHIYETSGYITYLDPSTNPYSYRNIATAGYTVNAVGYNYEDGLLYAIERGTPIAGTNFIRIDATGGITVMRTAPWLGWVGDCDLSGNLYVIDDNGLNLAKYDISANTYTTRATSGPAFLARDMAYRTQDGLFYGVYNKQLYVMNGNTGVNTAYNLTGSLADDYDSGINNGTWGATWTASDGFLYVGNNQSGRLYRVDVNARTSVYIGTGVDNLNNNDGASCPLADSPFPTTGTVGSQVWLDQNNDGLQTAGERGWPGITVSLYTSSGVFVRSTTSGSDGAYTFTGLSVGQYYLTFSGLPAGFVFALRDQGANDAIDSDPNTTTGQTATFTLGVGEIQDKWDAGIRTTGLGDWVWEDPDNDGIQDAGEAGFAGITAQLYTSGGTLAASKVTDATGFYYFAGLTAGSSYYVRFTNLPSGYIIGRQNRGTDDALDSDPAGGGTSGNTGNYAMTSNIFNTTVDCAVRQTTFPEIDIRGNNVTIADGDATPSMTDSTEFGSVSAASGTVRRTFTIRNLNTATAALSLTGSPIVEISGANASDFTVVVNPAVSIAIGGSTTFQVRFDPAATGLRTAVITIPNTDTDEDPYNFAVQGTGLAPEIEILGNGAVIADGDATPSTADHTDFGSLEVAGGTQDYTFTIRNSGNSALILSGSPIVQVTGAHASDFTVTAQPASSTVASGGGTVTFTVRFNPSAAGLRSAEITVANNDLDENPYNFSVQGTGTTSPEIDIRGNGVSIVDGDATPSASDSTDFGSGDILTYRITRTYSIANTGSGDLNLTGTPRVEIGGANAGDFLVSAQPSAAIVTAGGSLTFQVTFDPTLTGLRQATVTLYNSDSNENPYNFSIQGTGTAAPEIKVTGLDVEIASGDATPSVVDDTDFGSASVSGATVTHTFKIRNPGSAVLTLTGSSPYIVISGTNASDFSVTAIPDAAIDPMGDSTAFLIRFDPSAVGVRTASVSIANSDSDENPYTFSIQGTGVGVPQLVLSKSVDKATAVPGEALTYTIGYENIGTGNATAVTVLETVPAHTTYITGSVSASGMNVTYSHNGGAGYDGSDTAPVTHIKFQRPSALAPAESGSITFQVVID